MGARQELIELLQAWTKYVLTPKDKNRKAEIEKALILIGRKGTGKGTFLDVLIQLIGEENIGSASPDSFNDDKSMAQLLDKSVAMDTDASGFLASPGNFNKVVSNEPVPIKRLYQNPIATRLGCSVVLAMNKFPDTTAGSEGLDRRLCVVPFDHAPAVIGPQLSQKLKAELSGIFAWAWSLSPNEMKRRILWSGSIPAVQQASIDRFEANNPVALFLQETYPEGTPEGTPIQAKNLYAAYTAWCQDTGSKPKSQKWLSEGLDVMGCKKSRSSQNCVVYQIPPMKDFDAAVHLGLVHLVAVDEQTQPLEPSGASGRFPDFSPDDSNLFPDSIPELPDDSLQNFTLLNLSRTLMMIL
jgi:P4 family phage/plasmid primase-like protien